MRPSTFRKRLPSLPPGWRAAKSSGWNPFSTDSAIASASPITSCAVVDAVGARFSGQASSRIAIETTTSAPLPSVESFRPVIATSVAPRRLTCGISATISSVSPECESARTTSPFEDHPEVAVDRLGRVQEERGRARRGERRGDLLADDAALADARDDDAAGRGLHGLDGAVEALVEAVRERADGRRLDLDDAAGLLPCGTGQAGRVYLPLPRSTVRTPVAGSRRTRRPSASRKSDDAGRAGLGGRQDGSRATSPAVRRDEPVAERGDRARTRRPRQTSFAARCEAGRFSSKGKRATATRPGAISPPRTTRAAGPRSTVRRGVGLPSSPSKKSNLSLRSGDPGDGDPVAREESSLRAPEILQRRDEGPSVRRGA